MARWLVKSEPGTWSWDQHANAGQDAWTGVRNHQAKLHLMAMKPGDQVLYYHSGDEKAVVGTSRVARASYTDPTDAKAAFVAVDLKAEASFPRAVTLTEIKAEPKLKDMVLVKNSRLSVQPVSEDEWAVVARMGGAKA